MNDWTYVKPALDALALAAWVMAIASVIQMFWGFVRDAQFLKKNGDALAWDNERSVILANSEKAEHDAKTWHERAEGLNDIAAKQGAIIRELRARLQKAGIDDTH